MAKEKTWTRYDNKRSSLTEEEIKDIVDKKYCNCLPKTKEYIANNLRAIGPKFRAKIYIEVREDFIEEFKKIPNLGEYDFDFSQVPEVIKSQMTEFYIICKEKICGVEIGRFKVSRYKLFTLNKNPLKDNLTKFFKRHLTEDKNLRDKYIKRVTESLGRKFILDEIRFVDLDTTPMKITCRKCGEVYWCTLKKLLSLDECRNCKSLELSRESREIMGDKWLEKAKAKHTGKCDYSRAVYNGEREAVTGLVCLRCGNEFSQIPAAHLNSPYGYCPSCCKKIVGEHGRSNIDNVKIKAIERYGDVFTWDKANYTTNQTPITLIYKETGEEFQITPNHLLNGVGLPIFHTNSWGERNAVRWFEENNIKYRSEVTIKDIEGRKGEGSRVRIDFILEDGTWIELNGKQHYEFSQSFQDYINLTYEEAKDKWEGQLRRDENVKNYCKENNIRLLVIPYTYYDYPILSDLLYKLVILKESIDIIKQPEIIYGKI